MSQTDHKFLEEAPEGFDPTMELAWRKSDVGLNGCNTFYERSEDGAVQVGYIVLCQKYREAFRDCLVRVPIDG